MTHPSSSYQFALTTHPSEAYQPAPTTPMVLEATTYLSYTEGFLLNDLLFLRKFHRISSQSGGDNVGGFYFSLSDDEESDVQFVSQATSNFTNITNMAKKQKATSNGNKAAKKRKTRDMESQLEGINHSFQMFVQGFNANFGTMTNVVANAMTDDNNRKKAKSEQLKDVLVELAKLDISSGDVLHATEIFAANKDKLDLFLNLPHQLRVSYVHKLTGLSSGRLLVLAKLLHFGEIPSTMTSLYAGIVERGYIFWSRGKSL
ncbi:hypothetical protein Tco_1500039 [Tanacetum coccineum]